MSNVYDFDNMVRKTRDDYIDRQDMLDKEMIKYISTDVGLFEALTEGVSTELDIEELRGLISDCIELRGGKRESLDLVHRMLGQFLANRAIKFLEPYAESEL